MLDAPPTDRPDWSALAGQIIEDAQATLGASFVLLSQYDAERQVTRQVGWGGLRLRNMQRGLALARRLVPHYDSLHPEVPVADNPYTRAIFLEGRHEVVVASIAELSAGVAPPLIAHIFSRIAGAHHGVVIPLLVEGKAIGSITCFQAPSHLSPRELAIIQAFARQVALSIHNAQLLFEQRRTAAALDQSRQLVLEAQDHTRREISELLHSRVQSRLLVAWHQLSMLDDLNPAQRRQVETIRADLERLREEEVRRLSHQLHPEGLQVGLIAALQVLSSSLAGALEVQIRANSALVEADLPGADGLPPEVRLLVFRAMEEALSNVLKHAHTRQATLTLELRGDQLHAEAQDAGVGFDPRAVRPGLGVRLLMARAQAVRGEWGIESRPGGPTRVWLRVRTGSGDGPEC